MAAELRPHKELLQRMYLRDGMPLSKVRSTMCNLYSIYAAESTYQRLFREWGLKKNTKKDNWKWVLHKKRESGKDGPLFIRGSRVSDDTVSRQVSRHVLPSEQALIAAGAEPRPSTPEGFRFGSPESPVAPEPAFEEMDCDHDSESCSGAPSCPQQESPFEVGSLGANRVTTSSRVRRLGCWSSIEESIMTHALRPQGAVSKAMLEHPDRYIVMDTLRCCTLDSWPRSVRKRGVSLEAVHYGVTSLLLSATRSGFGCENTDLANCALNCIQAALRNDTILAKRSVKLYLPPVWRDQFRAALFLAVKKGHIMIVNTLLAMFASHADEELSLRDHMQKSCVHIAAANNNPRMLDYLLRRKSQREYLNDADADGETLFSTVRAWLNRSASDLSYLSFPHDVFSILHRACLGASLFTAITQGDIEGVRQLVEKGAELTYTDFKNDRRLQPQSTGSEKPWLEWQIAEILRDAKMSIYFRAEDNSYVMEDKIEQPKHGFCAEELEILRDSTEPQGLPDVPEGKETSEGTASTNHEDMQTETDASRPRSIPRRARQINVLQGMAALEMDLTSLSISSPSRVLEEGSLSWNPKRMMHPWNNGTPVSGEQSISRWRAPSSTKSSLRRNVFQMTVIPSPDMPEMVP